ncbi:MAG: ABC transporter ATP-binding protein [Candidatus Porifericomitaceae bacterium WSBS_2022_MAG_OTU9]
MSEIVLSCSALSRNFKLGDEQIEVLRSVELQVAAGESVAITGESGCGKSTLLYLLGGLDRADSGQVHASSTSFIFQFHHLLPEFSVLENVAMPMYIAGRSGATQRAAGLLARVGLEHRLTHRPGELSGGERQRVAVARALATSARCLLADEPTGNLDGQNSENVYQLLLSLAVEENAGLVLVTHNISLASRCSRRLLLEQGRLVEIRP